MFDIKVLRIMLFVLIAGYCILMVLHSSEKFNEICEKGGFAPFENLLISMCLLYIIMGAYYNGYIRGVENGKTESNKT